MSILQSGSHIKDTDGMEFGYITPRHGFKGKQYAINSDEDVTQMYDVYKKLLFCGPESHSMLENDSLNSILKCLPKRKS